MKNKIRVVKHFRVLFQEWAGVTDRRSIPAAARCHRPMSPCPHLIPATLPLDSDPLNAEKERKMAIDFHDNQHIYFFPLGKSMLRCDVLKLKTGVTESVASEAQTLAFSTAFNAVSNAALFQQALTNTSISPYANLTKSVQSSGHFFVS